MTISIRAELLNDKESFISMAYEKFNCIGILECNLNEEKIIAGLGSELIFADSSDLSKFDRLDELLAMDKDCVFYFRDEEDAYRMENLLIDSKIDFQTEVVAEEDWNATWKEKFKEIEVSKNIKVVPSWIESDENADETTFYLRIYPGQGFGTGSHPTTALCLKQLDELIYQRNININSFCDFGCGSGILGIAALKMFPTSHGLFVDIDENALENTRQNLELNTDVISSRMSLLRSQAIPKHKSFDLIFANILMDVLTDNVNFIQKSLTKEGHVIFSGILLEQENEFLSFISTAKSKNRSMKLVRTLRLDGWVSFLFKIHLAD